MTAKELDYFTTIEPPQLVFASPGWAERVLSTLGRSAIRGAVQLRQYRHENALRRLARDISIPPSLRRDVGLPPLDQRPDMFNYR